jgi:hypothetical protein
MAHNVEVDRAGFEPAASALRTRRSYRTDLPALFWKNTVIRAFRAFGGYVFGFRIRGLFQNSRTSLGSNSEIFSLFQFTSKVLKAIFFAT